MFRYTARRGERRRRPPDTARCPCSPATSARVLVDASVSTSAPPRCPSRTREKQMQWFGPQGGGDPADEMRVPVGAVCSWCSEPVEQDDSGVVLPLLAANAVYHGTAVYHLECFMRTVVGSVGHQLK